MLLSTNVVPSSDSSISSTLLKNGYIRDRRYLEYCGKGCEITLIYFSNIAAPVLKATLLLTNTERLLGLLRTELLTESVKSSADTPSIAIATEPLSVCSSIKWCHRLTTMCQYLLLSQKRHCPKARKRRGRTATSIVTQIVLNFQANCGRITKNKVLWLINKDN